MSVLVIGGTGQIGSLVLKGLEAEGATARVLTTDHGGTDLPKGMTPVTGDLLDPASVREALVAVDTVFLLASVSPSELMQSSIAIDLAQEAGVKHMIYFSQVKLNWPDCPHAVAKAGAEALIRHHGLPATILRPAYFFQNDKNLRNAVLGGTYPVPIGNVGVQMIDARDIAAVAVLTILNRAAFEADPLLELVGPDVITGQRAAEIWSEASGRPVAYGGDDLGRAFEDQQAEIMPGWQAHDLVGMFRGCQRDGMQGAPRAADRLVHLLGRPLRTYRAFVEEMHGQWRGESETRKP